MWFVNKQPDIQSKNPEKKFLQTNIFKTSSSFVFCKEGGWCVGGSPTGSAILEKHQPEGKHTSMPVAWLHVTKNEGVIISYTSFTFILAHLSCK